MLQLQDAMLVLTVGGTQSWNLAGGLCSAPHSNSGKHPEPGVYGESCYNKLFYLFISDAFLIDSLNSDKTVWCFGRG